MVEQVSSKKVISLSSQKKSSSKEFSLKEILRLDKDVADFYRLIKKYRLRTQAITALNQKIKNLSH